MSEKSLVDYYARRAQEYERIYDKPERQPELRALQVALADAFRGRRVLEIACGTGYWSQYLAPAAVALHGVDCNEEVLTLARAKGIPRATFARGDAYALAVGRRDFDAAFAGFWWSHMPKARLPGFLEQLHGVLRPGAKAVFIDNCFVAGSSTPIDQVDAQGDAYQVRTLGDGTRHVVLKNFPTDAELCSAVAAAGGVAPTVHRQQYYWRLEYRTPAAG